MSSKTTTSHPTHSRSMIEEADIGSGERTPGQQETDNIVKDIPPQGNSGNSGRDTHRKESGSDASRGERGAAEAERGAEHASENDRAGHGQIQREQGRSRQDAEPGMTPDAPV